MKFSLSFLSLCCVALVAAQPTCMTGSCPPDVTAGITCLRGIQLSNVPAAQSGVGTCICNWQHTIYGLQPLYTITAAADCTQNACSASSSSAGDSAPSFVNSTALAAWITHTSVDDATNITGSLCGSMAIVCNSNAVSRQICPPALVGSTLSVQFPLYVGNCAGTERMQLYSVLTGDSGSFFDPVSRYSSSTLSR